MYWRKPGGYTIITDPDHGVKEMHSFTCCHCCRVTFVPAKADPVLLGGRCTCCDDLICKYCVDKPCYPMEKWLQHQESRRSIFEAS